MIAGNGAGYGVVSDAFGNRHGVFTHTDPLDEILLNTNNSETNSTISELCRNLDTLNKCRVQHDSFDVFKKYQRKTVQRNEFIRDACSVSGIPGETEDICLTSTNILMKMCSRYSYYMLFNLKDNIYKFRGTNLQISSQSFNDFFYDDVRGN